MHFTGVLLFALAVSLDSLAVGAAYSMRRIRVPLSSLITLGFISCVASLISLATGRFLGDVIDGRVSGAIGGILLILLGLWQLVRSTSEDKGEDNREDEHVREMPPGHSILLLLAHPEGADRDLSGVLSIPEAALLGFALCLDAAGAGFAIGVSGICNLYLPLLVGGVSGGMVWAGFRLGSLFVRQNWGRGCDLLPGLILMGIGVSRFFL